MIDINKSQQIFKLESYWHGFSQALNLFKTTSGKQLQQGHGDTMAIYREGLRLYNEGLGQINFLKEAKTTSDVSNIISISDLLIARGENFKRNLRA